MLQCKKNARIHYQEAHFDEFVTRIKNGTTCGVYGIIKPYSR